MTEAAKPASAVRKRTRPAPSQFGGVVPATPLSKEEFLARKAKQEQEAEVGGMALAVQAIFGDAKNEIKLRNGKTVVVKPATMGQLPQIMLFFGGVVQNMDSTQLAELIDTVVNKQRAAIARGADPASIDLRELSSNELVGKAFGQVSILTSLMTSVFTLLPELVGGFTNLDAAEFRALELDEGVLVAAGIFTLNYHFFTQNLPPLLTASVRQWASQGRKKP